MRWGLVVCVALVGCKPGTGSRSSGPDASDELARAEFEKPSSLRPSAEPVPPIDFTPGFRVPFWEPAPQGPPGLTEGQLATVMRSHQAGVKRTCWVNVDRGGATSASVLVHITIAPNGDVTNVRAEGNNGAVGKCLEKEIGTWVFPAAEGASSVDQGYKFAMQ